MSAAHFIKCHIRSCETADNQYGYLDDVCKSDYFHATQCDKNRKNRQRDHDDMQIINIAVLSATVR